MLTSLKEFIKFPCNLLVQTESNQFLILSTLLHIFRLVLFSVLRLLLHLSSAIVRHAAATTATSYVIDTEQMFADLQGCDETPYRPH